LTWWSPFPTSSRALRPCERPACRRAPGSGLPGCSFRQHLVHACQSDLQSARSRCPLTSSHRGALWRTPVSARRGAATGTALTPCWVTQRAPPLAACAPHVTRHARATGSAPARALQRGPRGAGGDDDQRQRGHQRGLPGARGPGGRGGEGHGRDRGAALEARARGLRARRARARPDAGPGAPPAGERGLLVAVAAQACTGSCQLRRRR